MVVKTIPLLLPPPLVGTQPAPPGGESLWPLSENWLKIKWILVKTPKKFRHLRPTLVIRGGGGQKWSQKPVSHSEKPVSHPRRGRTHLKQWLVGTLLVYLSACSRTHSTVQCVHESVAVPGPHPRGRCGGGSPPRRLSGRRRPCPHRSGRCRGR